MFHPGDLRQGDAVPYTGPDDDDDRDPLWTGHPARVVDVDPTDGEVVVDYVAKGAECVGGAHLVWLSEEEYQRRAARLLANLHPLHDRRVGPGPLLDRNHVP